MGIVVAVAAVLALAVCGCIGVGGVLLDRYAPQPVAEDPYDDDPYYDPDDLPYPTAPAPEPTPTRKPATVPSVGSGRLKVVYEVTGANPVDLQFYDANGDFFQLDGVRSPWRLAFTANDRERVQVIATPGDLADADEATCRITVNGKVVSQDTGQYGATCFGW